MEESKAISSEIKGLFEVIKLQTDEYNQAFQVLHSKIEELLNIKNDIDSFKSKISAEFYSFVRNSQNKLDDAVTAFNSKLDKTNALYENLNEIKILKEELKNSDLKLQELLKSSDSFINSFRTNTTTELNSLVRDIKLRTDKEFSSLNAKLDTKLDLKFKRIESRIAGYDQKLLTLNDNQLKDFNLFNDKLENFNERLIKSKLPTSDNMINNEEFINSQLNDLIQSLTDDIYKSINNLDKKLSNIETKIITLESDFSLSSLNNLINKNLKDIPQKADKASHTAIIASIISAIAILTSILALFLLLSK